MKIIGEHFLMVIKSDTIMKSIGLLIFAFSSSLPVYADTLQFHDIVGATRTYRAKIYDNIEVIVPKLNRKEDAHALTEFLVKENVKSKNDDSATIDYQRLTGFTTTYTPINKKTNSSATPGVLLTLSRVNNKTEYQSDDGNIANPLEFNPASPLWAMPNKDLSIGDKWEVTDSGKMGAKDVNLRGKCTLSGKINLGGKECLQIDGDLMINDIDTSHIGSIDSSNPIITKVHNDTEKAFKTFSSSSSDENDTTDNGNRRPDYLFTGKLSMAFDPEAGQIVEIAFKGRQTNAIFDQKHNAQINIVENVGGIYYLKGSGYGNLEDSYGDLLSTSPSNPFPRYETGLSKQILQAMPVSASDRITLDKMTPYDQFIILSAAYIRKVNDDDFGNRVHNRVLQDMRDRINKYNEEEQYKEYSKNQANFDRRGWGLPPKY